jgi:septal ring factor EnvC (AmiA/AmiB activator)
MTNNKPKNMKLLHVSLLLSITLLLASTAPARAASDMVRISRADLKATLEHIQRLAKDSEQRADKAESDLGHAQKDKADLQQKVTKLEDDRDAQAKAHAECAKKLWWWRLHFWGAAIIGILLLSLGIIVRFTSWGAKTLGPILVKGAML